MMNELKKHYMESIDIIMHGKAMALKGRFRYTTDIDTNLSLFIDKLIDGYTPSEEVQFVAKYLRSKYNVNIWRLKNGSNRNRKKVLN